MTFSVCVCVLAFPVPPEQAALAGYRYIPATLPCPPS
ncbi:hypothetical protein CFIMG_006830RA, partial [Ceratocystis fimbriata CBS 114723]